MILLEFVRSSIYSYRFDFWEKNNSFVQEEEINFRNYAKSIFNEINLTDYHIIYIYIIKGLFLFFDVHNKLCSSKIHENQSYFVIVNEQTPPLIPFPRFILLTNVVV